MNPLRLRATLCLRCPACRRSPRLRGSPDSACSGSVPALSAPAQKHCCRCRPRQGPARGPKPVHRRRSGCRKAPHSRAARLIPHDIGEASVQLPPPPPARRRFRIHKVPKGPQRRIPPPSRNHNPPKIEPCRRASPRTPHRTAAKVQKRHAADVRDLGRNHGHDGKIPTDVDKAALLRRTGSEQN